MTELTNIGWLNLNAQRAYPLSEQATGVDASGSIQLPFSFIVAMQLPVQAFPTVDPQNFFLFGLVVASAGYTVTVGYYNGTIAVPAATASIAAASHVENNTYQLIGTGAFSASVGSITIGVLDDINALPAGQYFFTQSGGLLDPDVIRPHLQQLSSLTLINGSETSPPIYGDVQLVAGTNISFSVVTIPNEPTVVVINAISGQGLNQTCSCSNNASLTPIYTINGIPGDVNGNFVIAGQSCITVTSESNGLSLTNTCASPCCGCSELDALNTQLSLLSNNVATMQNFQSNLNSAVTQMSMVVLGSRLGDNTCGTN